MITCGIVTLACHKNCIINGLMRPEENGLKKGGGMIPTPLKNKRIKMDLQLVSTENLMTELLSRHTFYGVIIKSDGDFKQGVDIEKSFKLYFNSNIPRSQVCSIMYGIAEEAQLKLESKEYE